MKHWLWSSSKKEWSTRWHWHNHLPFLMRRLPHRQINDTFCAFYIFETNFVHLHCFLCANILQLLIVADCLLKFIMIETIYIRLFVGFYYRICWVPARDKEKYLDQDYLLSTEEHVPEHHLICVFKCTSRFAAGGRKKYTNLRVKFDSKGKYV